jgi:hypothetical protein
MSVIKGTPIALAEPPRRPSKPAGTNSTGTGVADTVPATNSIHKPIETNFLIIFSSKNFSLSKTYIEISKVLGDKGKYTFGMLKSTDSLLLLFAIITLSSLSGDLTRSPFILHNIYYPCPAQMSRKKTANLRFFKKFLAFSGGFLKNPLFRPKTALHLTKGGSEQ